MSDSNGDIENDRISSEQSISNIYKLTPDILWRHHTSNDRRAYKNQLSDRRSKLRLTVSGEPQSDRRMANRLANEKLHKKTS